jgi:hypothetical protein
MANSRGRDGIEFHTDRLLNEANAMRRVAILPVPTAMGALAYRAMAGDKHSEGSTAGAALDALTAQFPEDEAGMLVIVQTLRPDHFFNAAQQQRLADLMGRWRKARDQGGILPADEQAELNALVEAEVRASADRAAALADEAGR